MTQLITSLELIIHPTYDFDADWERNKNLFERIMNRLKEPEDSRLIVIERNDIHHNGMTSDIFGLDFHADAMQQLDTIESTHPHVLEFQMVTSPNREKYLEWKELTKEYSFSKPVKVFGNGLYRNRCVKTGTNTVCSYLKSAGIKPKIKRGVSYRSFA